MARKIQLGQVLATMAVVEFCRIGVDLGPYIDRHAAGDWGDVDEATRQENEHALEHGGAVRSLHHPMGRRMWIITDENRTRTVIMHPADGEPK